MPIKHYLPKPLLALALTLALVFIHPFLPERQITIWPSDYYPRFLTTDSDHNRQGASTAEWLDKARNYWVCNYRNSGIYSYCGAHFDVSGARDSDGIDLSGYNRVIVEAHYQGNAPQLRLSMRNFDDAFSISNQPATAKYQSVKLSADELKGEIEVYLSEFHVDDWWKENMSVPMELTRPDFSNITAIGFDYIYPTPEGEHKLIVKSLRLRGELVSAEHWYLGILLFWIGLLLTLAARQLLLLSRQAHLDDETITRLSKKNLQLQAETDHYMQMSTTDKLTGLLNRRGLEAVLSRFYRSDKHREQISVLIMTLDQIKKARTGDGEQSNRLMKQSARFLLNNISSYDRVCRWGDEEFLLLCSIQDQAQTLALAEKLRRGLHEMFDSSGPDAGVTVSIGLAHWHKEEDFEQSFNRAEKAFHQALDRGGNCFVFAERETSAPE